MVPPAITKTPLEQRLGLATIAALLATVALYAVLRAVAVVFGNEPDPALVAWSMHTAMYWRLAAAAYSGGAAGFAVYLVSGAHPHATTRWMFRAVPLVALVLAVQGLLLP